MRNLTAKVLTVAIVLLLVGCTGQQQTTGTGIILKNELSSERMQPGGQVLLRASVNNFFDKELKDAQAKLTRTFGSLTISDPHIVNIGTIQANPNATARAQWSLAVSKSAVSGNEFTDRVRLCFHYNQTAWHELSIVNSFDIQTETNTGGDTGPLVITFSGIETSYIQNEQVQSTIPISVSIRNNYPGYIGTINMPKDQIPNLTYVEMRIYDAGGGCKEDPEFKNGSPCKLASDDTGTNIEIIKDFTSPACGDKDVAGCFNCSNALWGGAGKQYFKCYANNISVFGDETFIGAKLNVTQLNAEELIEKVEVMASFDYCIESEEFTLAVFVPGGK